MYWGAAFAEQSVGACLSLWERSEPADGPVILALHAHFLLKLYPDFTVGLYAESSRANTVKTPCASPRLMTQTRQIIITQQTSEDGGHLCVLE